MKIRKNDTVLIISGKDRAKKGKVVRVFPKINKIVVEGINLRKKHVRPKRTGEKGQIISLPLPIDVSDVKIICPKCGRAARIGYKVEAGEKVRVCKKCGGEI
jgi:large subunit ribosomal protein L24